jgi:hypothetical protein
LVEWWGLKALGCPLGNSGIIGLHFLRLVLGMINQGSLSGVVDLDSVDESTSCGAAAHNLTKVGQGRTSKTTKSSHIDGDLVTAQKWSGYWSRRSWGIARIRPQGLADQQLNTRRKSKSHVIPQWGFTDRSAMIQQTSIWRSRIGHMNGSCKVPGISGVIRPMTINGDQIWAILTQVAWNR